MVAFKGGLNCAKCQGTQNGKPLCVPTPLCASTGFYIGFANLRERTGIKLGLLPAKSRKMVGSCNRVPHIYR